MAGRESVSQSFSQRETNSCLVAQLYCIRAGTDTGAAAAGGGAGTIQPSLHRTKTRVKLTIPHTPVYESRIPFWAKVMIENIVESLSPSQCYETRSGKYSFNY